MTIPRISTDVEKPFRDAVGHALRNEFEEMREGLLHLTDDQIASCLNMCAFVAGYVAIDVCGRQWPDKDNLRGIGEAMEAALATDLDLLPALMLRSRRLSSPGAAQR